MLAVIVIGKSGAPSFLKASGVLQTLSNGRVFLETTNSSTCRPHSAISFWSCSHAACSASGVISRADFFCEASASAPVSPTPSCISRPLPVQTNSPSSERRESMFSCVIRPARPETARTALFQKRSTALTILFHRLSSFPFSLSLCRFSAMWATYSSMTVCRSSCKRRGSSPYRSAISRIPALPMPPRDSQS